MKKNVPKVKLWYVEGSESELFALTIAFLNNEASDNLQKRQKIRYIILAKEIFECFEMLVPALAYLFKCNIIYYLFRLITAQVK